jgi:hypothetical protein
LSKPTRDAFLGIAAALLAVVWVIGLSMIGRQEGNSDHLMALSIRLTELGVPLSFLVLELADFIGAGSTLFPIVYVLLLGTILFEWAVGAMLVGWAIRRLRRPSGTR